MPINTVTRVYLIASHFKLIAPARLHTRCSFAKFTQLIRKELHYPQHARCLVFQAPTYPRTSKPNTATSNQQFFHGYVKMNLIITSLSSVNLNSDIAM